MITVRKGSDRGHLNFGWLDTFHTFSFGDYRDPKHMHFRALRVINEDTVAPGQGFDAHPHRDMEILTYVVKGALRHGDDIGSGGHSEILRPGEVQRISAGSGIVHSEHNASDSEPVHLLQIWIMPQARGLEPRYEQREFPRADRTNRLRLVASPDGAEGSLAIYQDARMYAGLIDAGAKVDHALADGRGAWVQVVKGDVAINGTALTAGDGAAVEKEKTLEMTSRGGAEVLVFDLS